MTSPTVFISYSHDSPEHADRVLDLADRLMQDGIDVILDQYESSPPEGWPRWMDKHIRAADFVLMVCTETYFRRVMGEEKPGTGLGVKWEGNLIYQHIYNANTTNTRFIPVLFENGQVEHIPTPLQGATYYHMDTSDGYEACYRRMTNQPRIKKPELGKLRTLPSRERKQDFFQKAGPKVSPDKLPESALASATAPGASPRGGTNITGQNIYIGEIAGRDIVKYSIESPAPASPERVATRHEELRVDAAAPNQVYLGRTFDLAVAVRQPSSPVLDEADLPRVHSGQVQVDWLEGESFLRLQVQVSAPECEIHGEDRQSFRLRPGHDSPVFYFHLTPKQLGEIGVVVTVYQENDWMGSARVHTLVREEMVGRVQMVVTSHTFQQPGEEPVIRKDDLLLKMSPAQLHTLLCKDFNLDDLRELCLNIEVDWDALAGETKNRKALELIEYMRRRDRLPELAAVIRRARPNI